jgi:hypothetical protein
MGELVRTRGEIAPLSLPTFNERIAFAQTIAKTEAGVKIGTAEDIFLRIEFGSTVNLSPMQALKSVAVINGRGALYGEGFLAVLFKSPLFVIEAFSREFIGEEPDVSKFNNASEYLKAFPDNFAAVCTMQRRDLRPSTTTFSVGDARIAGLWHKQGPWSQYPARMLMWKAIQWCGRDLFPDVLNGMDLAEDIAEVEFTERPKSRQGIVSAAREKAREAFDEFTDP